MTDKSDVSIPGLPSKHMLAGLGHMVVAAMHVHEQSWDGERSRYKLSLEGTSRLIAERAYPKEPDQFKDSVTSLLHILLHAWNDSQDWATEAVLAEPDNGNGELTVGDVLQMAADLLDYKQRVTAATNCLVCLDVADPREIAENAYMILTEQLPVVQVKPGLQHAAQTRQVGALKAELKRQLATLSNIRDKIAEIAELAGVLPVSVDECEDENGSWEVSNVQN